MMGTIEFTNKPDSEVADPKVAKEKVKIIQEDKSWCRSYCINCPYFVNDEFTKMMYCVRPVGENCLADGILVAGYIMKQAQDERLREMATAEATYIEQRKSITHKKIKRRR